MLRLVSFNSKAAVAASAAASSFSSLNINQVVRISSASPVSLTTIREFNSKDRISDEFSPMYKMKAITPMIGQPKPCLRENDWTLRFNLTDKMANVIQTLLKEENWADAEIDREVSNFFGIKHGRVHIQPDLRSSWETVEDFQRTPWYRRWRPNERSSIPMVSIDCMKILEKHLIPPSARHDPYAHLRKRHYEDTYHNEKYSEGNIRDLSREKLASYTKGMPQYGKHSRKEFLAFEKEYKKKQPGMSMHQHETYNAWKSSQR